MKEPTLKDVLSAVGRVEKTQRDHGGALLELAADVKQIRGTLTQHSTSLERIERRQRAETMSLDDHEGRIKQLERRRKSGRAPES